MSMPYIFWITCAISIAIAITAGWADRQRLRRADLDRVSLMPWTMILLLALLVAVVSLVLALKVR
jgi:hypothetical protein